MAGRACLLRRGLGIYQRIETGGSKDTQGPHVPSSANSNSIYPSLSDKITVAGRIEPLSLINMPSPTWGSCVIWENRIIADAMRRVIRGQAKTLNIVAFRKHLGGNDNGVIIPRDFRLLPSVGYRLAKPA